MTDPGRIHAGHTLPELVTMLSIVAILATAAVPAFSSLLLDSRMNSAVTSTLHALNFARQFSATRGETIELCGAGAQEACVEDEIWTAGFQVRGESGELHRAVKFAGGAGAPRIRSNRAILRFEGGSGFASPATLTICDRRGARAARAVIVSRSGRPRVSARDAAGEPLAC
jgi:type IV fimbrial biogenesis protein FimT